jgi:hypothetical protein
MAKYIVPAEMPKSCAHCQFSILKASHPFWSKENPNTKKYHCALADLSIEVDFNDYTTKADWCPLVDASDFVPKRTLEMSQHLLKESWETTEKYSELCGQKEAELAKVQAEVIKAFAEKVKPLFEEIVELMFDDNESKCRISNCHKPTSIRCGSRLCIDENVDLWKAKVDDIAIEMMEGE